MKEIEPLQHFVQHGAAAASHEGKYLIFFLNSNLWGGHWRRKKQK